MSKQGRTVIENRSTLSELNSGYKSRKHVLLAASSESSGQLIKVTREDARMAHTILEKPKVVSMQVFEHRRARHPITWLCPNCQTVHPIHQWHHGIVDGREYCNYCNAKRVILSHMKSTSWRIRSRYCRHCGWRGQVNQNNQAVNLSEQNRVI